jgi:hypothetical protein
MAIETKEREDLTPFAFVCLYLSDDVDAYISFALVKALEMCR